MNYISSLTFITERKDPFPFNVPAIRFARDLRFDAAISFIVGDNGAGKSTLLEAIALKLNLPLIGGFIDTKRGFEAASTLQDFLDLKEERFPIKGFFFRAEDFSHFVDSIDRQNRQLESQFYDLRGQVPDHIIDQMKNSHNFAHHNQRNQFGHDLITFSHGEAYMKMMHERIKEKGIYLLDEPEAALSPAKQLSLIYFIKDHLSKFDSQFLIATHSPILMATPGAEIFEVSEASMEKVDLEDTEHYFLTKSFLNDPEGYLRHL